MSVARVQYVKAARKDQGVCGKCRAALPAGSPYRWYTVGFRSKYVNKRCMKSECTPRTSELESSKMADVYAAQESFQDAIAELRNAEPGENSDVVSLVEDLGSSVSDTAQEYRDADEAIGGGGTGTVSEERADALEAAADELGGFSANTDMEDVEPCDVHTDDWQPEEGDEATLDEVRESCDDCRSKREEAWQELLDEAEGFVGDIDWGV